jgi:hypothetical protein
LRRNASVHQGESTSRAETLIFQLKRYVEMLMLFHLNFGWRYSSAEEVGQLLSRPRDLETLRKRIAELKAELSLNRAAMKLHDSSDNSAEQPEQGSA